MATCQGHERGKEADQGKGEPEAPLQRPGETGQDILNKVWETDGKGKLVRQRTIKTRGPGRAGRAWLRQRTQ